eukprot:TRINITY_DN21403_c0_g1_i1.p1 TRINITY_DN21403_c0_g1~~TRINITY_DN21403_c0_g1_i1.p1  ORF type:complete len:172 (-),score=13.59 TRINITY_DN21403_c0_g1_i1:167-682(-)
MAAPSELSRILDSVSQRSLSSPSLHGASSRGSRRSSVAKSRQSEALSRLGSGGSKVVAGASTTSQLVFASDFCAVAKRAEACPFAIRVDTGAWNAPRQSSYKDTFTRHADTRETFTKTADEPIALQPSYTDLMSADCRSSTLIRPHGSTTMANGPIAMTSSFRGRSQLRHY